MMLTQAALPYLRQHRGRVINVSSGAATYAIPGWGAYCTAKGALNQFNRVLSIEEEMVTAVAVRPGVIDTDMQAIIRQMGAVGMPESAYQRFVQMREAGELLPPEAPGGAIAVLALFHVMLRSPEASPCLADPMVWPTQRGCFAVKTSLSMTWGRTENCQRG
jgi:NAD(P)-dependent dehydrogenase (short-subunit alcohol dehydrogenase family)